MQEQQRQMIGGSSEPWLSTVLHQKGSRLGLPISGTFELTSRCNFDCKMCYIHGKNCAELQKEELSAAEWIELGKKARDAGTVFLLITGGEPLIRSDFREIYTELKKLGLVISLNTNASLLQEETAELLIKKPPYRLNVSLYGASGETYRRLCGNDAFDRVTENIRRMRENGVQVRLSYSAVPENCGDMQKIFELSKKLDAHIKGTTYMYPKMRADGGSAGTNSGRLSADQAAEYRIKWNKIRLSGDQYESSLRSLSPEDGECALMPEGEGVRCRAGRSSFWVNWRGEMSACGVMPYKAVSIKENGFDKCWELVKASTEKIRLPKECAVCGLRSVCNVCAAVCYCETGGFDRVPEYVCRLTHETARLAAKELAENTKKESGI